MFTPRKRVTAMDSLMIQDPTSQGPIGQQEETLGTIDGGRSHKATAASMVNKIDRHENEWKSATFAT